MSDHSGAAVALRGVSRSFGGYRAVDAIDLEIAAGRFVSLVGPSGCGKSTVLNIVAGLLPPTGGSVELFGEPLIGINRRASYMFQQDALLPWKTVLGNIELGLILRGRERADAARQAQQWIERVGLAASAGITRHN